jgi:hypothetical protein
MHVAGAQQQGNGAVSICTPAGSPPCRRAHKRTAAHTAPGVDPHRCAPRSGSSSSSGAHILLWLCFAVEPTWEGLVQPLEKLTDKHSRAWGVVTHLKVRLAGVPRMGGCWAENARGRIGCACSMQQSTAVLRAWSSGCGRQQIDWPATRRTKSPRVRLAGVRLAIVALPST